LLFSLHPSAFILCSKAAFKSYLWAGATKAACPKLQVGGWTAGSRLRDRSEDEQGLENTANCVLARSPCPWQYSRADNPLSACAWIREHHYSRIHAWLRLHCRFVSTAINDLHSSGLPEDESAAGRQEAASVSAARAAVRSCGSPWQRTTTDRMCNKHLSAHDT